MGLGFVIMGRFFFWFRDRADGTQIPEEEEVCVSIGGNEYYSFF